MWIIVSSAAVPPAKMKKENSHKQCMFGRLWQGEEQPKAWRYTA